MTPHPSCWPPFRLELLQGPEAHPPPREGRGEWEQQQLLLEGSGDD